MNINTVKPQPTDRVELVGYALEQSGHLWAAEREIKKHSLQDDPHVLTALVRTVYNQVYGWNVGGFTLSEVRRWVGSKLQAQDTTKFAHPQHGGDPSFVVGAKLAVMREVWADQNVTEGHVRAIMGRLAWRGITVSYEEAFKMWDEYRFG